MKNWPILAVLVLLVASLVWGKGAVEDYGKDRFLAGYEQGKSVQNSVQGEPWMREFAQAYCNLDAKTVSKHVSENLATLQVLQAEFTAAKQRGWNCQKVRVLGSWEGKNGTEFAFLISFPDYDLWWLAISQDGKVVHIE